MTEAGSRSVSQNKLRAAAALPDAGRKADAMRDGLKDAHRDAITAAIAANDRVERAVLFGSRATGTNTVSSDVDIALFGDRLTLTDQARLAAALDEIPMAQSVDLLLYDSIRAGKLREHIRNCGVEWYTRPKRPGIAVMAAERRRIEPEPVAPARTRHRQHDTHWTEVRLGTLVDIFDGPHATPRKTQEGPVFLGISNLSSGRLDFEKKEHLSEADYVRWTRRVTPRPNDIVFSYETRLGEAALIPEGLRACLGRRMGLLRPKAGAIDARYLLYAFLGEEFQNTLRFRTVHGSTVDRIPLTELAEFPISVPRAISEQCAIAHVLGTLDDKIDLNRRMNATLEAMARALFKSWFVDFHPVRAKMEGRDTGLPKDVSDLFPDALDDEDKPVGWETFTLADLAYHHRGSVSPSAHPKRTFEHYSIPAYDAGSEPTLDSGSSIKSNKTVVPEGAVLLSKLNPEIERVWLPKSKGGLPQVASTEFLAFTPLAAATRSVLFLMFKSEAFRVEMVAMVTGTSKSHQRVPPKALLTREVLTADPRILTPFDDMVRPLFDRLLANRQEARTLSQTRDLLLPKLMSGEIRLGV